MTTIDNTKQLPWTDLRIHLVKTEHTTEAQAHEAIKAFENFKCWLFKQTDAVWYLFVDVSRET